MGQVRKDSNQQIAAKERRAERAKCPRCGRKSALSRVSDEFQYGVYCRWDDCGYERITIR